jgi:hypothetical protein
MTFLIIGSIMTLLFWVSAWAHFGLLGEYSFFPLWLGYILITNGLSEITYGTSLLTRMRLMFGWLFVISIPLWWFFEQINKIVQNWHYELPHPISTVHYVAQASIDFATVIPAVLSTGYLLYPYVQGHLRRVAPCNICARASFRTAAFCLGIISFLLLLVIPHEAFPLVWIAPLLILEPAAYTLGLPCLLWSLKKGDLTISVTFMAATLITGFWWEVWNFYSMPKWYYTIPYVDFWRLFEMPALGYLGYPFFGLFVFSYTAVLLSIFTKTNLFEYFPPSLLTSQPILQPQIINEK